MVARGQKSRGSRQGNVFTLRVTPAERERLEAMCAADIGPKSLGPWILWRALDTSPVARWRFGSAAPGKVIPELGAGVGTTAPAGSADETPIAERLILDLCAGSGAWSEPYREAGYPVQRVTLPRGDVRVLPLPKVKVWGVLAAPPCEEFSLAKNGQPRDFLRGLETVSACMRVIVAAAPRWWALENPVGLLSRWLGRPALVFEPFEFGDPWSKRTALWGSFELPRKGPFVRAIDGGGPICSLCSPDAPAVCSVASHRAVTPGGFARAFREANP